MAARRAIQNITMTWVVIEHPRPTDCEHKALHLHVKGVAHCEDCGGRWQHPKMREWGGKP